MLALITSIALANGLPPGLLESICWVESNHRNTINFNDGPTASYGPCQIKAVAAKQVKPNVKGSELLRPELSIDLAARYLKWQYRRYGTWNQAIQAYNRGRVDKPFKPCYYVNKVVNKWHQYQNVYKN
jgi:hypothetical protein